MIADSGVDRYTANHRAAGFMKSTFEVDVTKFDWTGYDWTTKSGKSYDQKIQGLHQVMNVQLSDPIINEDPYFQGVANGLLLAESCFLGNDPEFVELKKKSKLNKFLRKLV